MSAASTHDCTKLGGPRPGPSLAEELQEAKRAHMRKQNSEKAARDAVFAKFQEVAKEFNALEFKALKGIERKRLKFCAVENRLVLVVAGHTEPSMLAFVPCPVNDTMVRAMTGSAGGDAVAWHALPSVLVRYLAEFIEL